MGKLKCLLMTQFTRLMSKIVNDGKHHYQGNKLSQYNKSVYAVEGNYCKAMVSRSDSMEPIFADLKDSLVFENLVDLLEIRAWPKKQFENFWWYEVTDTG